MFPNFRPIPPVWKEKLGPVPVDVLQSGSGYFIPRTLQDSLVFVFLPLPAHPFSISECFLFKIGLNLAGRCFQKSQPHKEPINADDFCFRIKPQGLGTPQVILSSPFFSFLFSSFFSLQVSSAMCRKVWVFLLLFLLLVVLRGVRVWPSTAQ